MFGWTRDGLYYPVLGLGMILSACWSSGCDREQMSLCIWTWDGHLMRDVQTFPYLIMRGGPDQWAGFALEEVFLVLLCIYLWW